MELELRVNGVVADLDIAPNETLLALLRREGYTSVKRGCETGECGACAVLVDGVPRPSCVMLAAQAGGCTLTTVESLGHASKLHPLQAAFAEVGAVQCGFCTSGMLLSAYALLKRNPAPSEEDVRDALSGNLCRCTSYARPVQAVLRAAAVLRGEQVAPLEQKVINHLESAPLPLTSKHRALASENTSNTSKIPAFHLAVGASSEKQLSVIGKSVQSIDAPRQVTGRASFAADIHPRGMLYGRILTSPHAHAIIRAIDISRAKSLPGVHAILTYKDVARTSYSSVERSFNESGPYDQYSLDYIVRYVGDRVAVVAAETPEVAEQALSLIDVTYDVLPAVLDLRQALNSGTPSLHPESESRGIYDAARNVATRIRTETGDMERGFADSDLIVEGEYIVPSIQQAPLENHTVVTYFDEDDYLVVRTSTQAPHHVRRTLAHILNLPLRRIRVVRPDVGGDFGVKQEIVLEDLCALLTLTTRQPVMMAHTRSEAFTSSRIGAQHIMRLKTGVKRDGTFVANQMVLLTSTGAHGTHPLTALNATSAISLYPCPNLRFIAEVLYTNQPPTGALRGYGSAEEFFALESHMDEIAQRLGMDALELRRKNWIEAGTAYPPARLLNKGKEYTPIIDSCGLPDCLQTVIEKIGWKEKYGKTGEGRLRRGVGIALSLQGNPALAVGSGGAIIQLNEDGSFDIFVGANANTSTLLAQIAAEVLGVSVEHILLHTSDTAVVPLETGVSASSALYLSGGAVKKAAEQVRRQITTVAGRMLNVLPEALKIQAGVLTGPNGQTLTLAQVATHSLYAENRHIMTTSSWKGQPTPLSFAALGIEVEVDSETGSISLLNIVVAVDGGRIINPLLAEAQIQGSISRALGAAVTEEMLYDQRGAPLTRNLRDYHLYSVEELPEIATYLVETYEPSEPFGAKAVGEVPYHAVAPALANALANALGGRIRQLPFTPERVLRAIHAQAQTEKK